MGHFCLMRSDDISHEIHRTSFVLYLPDHHFSFAILTLHVDSRDVENDHFLIQLRDFHPSYVSYFHLYDGPHILDSNQDRKSLKQLDVHLLWNAHHIRFSYIPDHIPMIRMVLFSTHQVYIPILIYYMCNLDDWELHVDINHTCP